MDKQILEYRNENMYTSYPFENGNIIEYITDACLFLDYPVKLTSIERGKRFRKIVINNLITFYYYFEDIFTATEYGKICVNKPSLEAMQIGQKIEYNINFLSTVCHGNFSLRLMNSHDSVKLECNALEIQNGNTIALSLPETKDIHCDCITSINGQPFQGVLGGDACTEANYYKGSVVLNDICKPPCYGCNERLTEGDVHKFMLCLEGKVDEIETFKPIKTGQIIVKSFEAEYEIQRLIMAMDSKMVLKTITVNVIEPYNNDYTLKIFDTDDVVHVGETDVSLLEPNTYKFDIYYMKTTNIVYLLNGSSGIVGSCRITVEFIKLP